MGLIVIVISLVLERTFGHMQHLRRMDWLVSYRQKIFSWVPDHWSFGYKGMAVLLLPVIVATLLLQSLFAGHWWGVLELLFSVAVVTYCLGPEAFNHQVDLYLDACGRGDRLAAKVVAEKLVGKPVADDEHRQAKQVTTAILYEGNVRIFAVLFWFLVLGPLGALLYRVVAALMHESRKFVESPHADASEIELCRATEKTFAVLDWLPAHILSLSFFLAGSFDDAWQGWRRVYAAEQELAERTRSIVVSTGCGAMQHEVDDAMSEESDEGDYDLQWIRMARALVWRSLVIWLVFVALITMANIGI